MTSRVVVQGAVLPRPNQMIPHLRGDLMFVCIEFVGNTQGACVCSAFSSKLVGSVRVWICIS